MRSDDFAIAGLRAIDCLTLAALCVFFFLKWTEPCLWLWDVPLLFRKVMGKLFVVDKWAATGEMPWPSGVSAGPGGRLSAFSSWLCYPCLALRPPGQWWCLFPSSAQERSPGSGWVLACKCVSWPRSCLRVLCILKTVCFFVQWNAFECTFIMLSGKNAFQSFLLIWIVSFNLVVELWGQVNHFEIHNRWGGRMA